MEIILKIKFEEEVNLETEFEKIKIIFKNNTDNVENIDDITKEYSILNKLFDSFTNQYFKSIMQLIELTSWSDVLKRFETNDTN